MKRDCRPIIHSSSWGAFPDDGAREAALKLLTGPSPPTAVLAVNNQAVLGLMRAL